MSVSRNLDKNADSRPNQLNLTVQYAVGPILLAYLVYSFGLARHRLMRFATDAIKVTD